MNFYKYVPTLFLACMIMSSIGFMNGILRRFTEKILFNALSLMAYIPDTWTLTYYQYLYGAIDFEGPWWHGYQ